MGILNNQPMYPQPSMNAEKFVLWLSGYLEAAGEHGLSPEQVAKIQAKMFQVSGMLSFDGIRNPNDIGNTFIGGARSASGEDAVYKTNLADQY